MIVFDKSEFQAVGVGPFGEAEIDRAGNGRRRDYNVTGHVRTAQARGLPVTLYLYCEPGSNSPEFQADLLCGVADELGIPRSMCVFGDIEEGSGDLRWFEDRFIGRVEFNGRVGACDTYSGDYFWRAHNLAGRGKEWKAAYGPNDGAAHTPPGGHWLLWQFTSVPLDTSTMSAEAMGIIFHGDAAKPPEPQRFYFDELLAA